MSDPSQTSDQKTSQDSHSVTSSPALVDGATHSDLQDGKTLDLFGLEVARVKVSQVRGRVKAPMTSDTYGQRSSNSYKHAVHPLYLGSR